MLVIKRENSVFYFLILIITIPTSASMSILNLKLGVVFYDGIAIGLLLACLVTRSKKGQPLKIPLYIALSLALYFTYFVIAAYSLSQYKYLLKDLRPIIQIVLFWMVYELALKHSIGSMSQRSILKLLLYAFSIVFLKLIYQSSQIQNIDDLFYSNNSYRYLDAVTYIAAITLIYSLSPYGNWMKSEGGLFYLVVLAAFICITVSSSRFILLSTFTAIAASNIKNVRNTFVLVILSTLGLYLFFYFSQTVGASRILDAMSIEGISLQLKSRFLPFVLMVDNFKWYNFIFGIGLGIPFEIPWFSYREGMDVYNSNIDSTYLTFFSKFGLMSMFFLPLLYGFFRIGIKGKFDKFIIIFLLMMFFVSATLYQVYSIGVFSGWLIVRMLEAKRLSK